MINGQIHFNFTPHNHTDTSMAAAIKALPKVGTDRRRILDSLDKYGPATNDQLADRLDMIVQTVSARMNYLWNFGLTRDSGKRRPTRTGSMAKVWELSP